MSNLGFGVMINLLGGNRETVETFKNAINKVISSVTLTDNELVFVMADGYKFKMFDDGQSCCETRYMVTDDNLNDFSGAILLEAKIKGAPSIADEWGDHEVQFLEIETNKGSFVLSNHNEHNGYYGGFSIICRPIG